MQIKKINSIQSQKIFYLVILTVLLKVFLVERSKRSIGPRSKQSSDLNMSTAMPHVQIIWQWRCSSQYENARRAMEKKSMAYFHIQLLRGCQSEMYFSLTLIYLSIYLGRFPQFGGSRQHKRTMKTMRVLLRSSSND